MRLHGKAAEETECPCSRSLMLRIRPNGCRRIDGGTDAWSHQSPTKSSSYLHHSLFSTGQKIPLTMHLEDSNSSQVLLSSGKSSPSRKGKESAFFHKRPLLLPSSSQWAVHESSELLAHWKQWHIPLEPQPCGPRVRVEAEATVATWGALQQMHM